VIARGAASIILAGALALGMSGCGFFAPQATLIQYAPSDGVEGNVGDIKIRNAVALSEDGTDASLIMSVINVGTSNANVDFQYVDAAGKTVTATVSVAGNSTLSVGNTGEDQLVLTGLDIDLGSLFPVYVQYGTEEGQELLVPVIPAEHSEYTGLTPTPLPTLSPTGTPEPAETPAP